MTLVWVGAVLFAVAGMTAILRATDDPDLSGPEWLEAAPFGVAIGTSLVRNAFPPDLAGIELPNATPTGRIVRMSQSDLSDTGIVRRVRRAVDLGVKEIFVEIDPMIRTLRLERDQEGLAGLSHFSMRLRAAAVGLAQRWLGIVDADLFDRSFYDESYDGNGATLAQYYPARVHPPRDPSSVAEAISLANQRGLMIVWMAMPRSTTAADYLGTDFRIAFDDQLDRFATGFAARIWRPAESWSDKFFVDQAHLNAAGRARFLKELRLYMAQLRNGS